MLAFLLYMKSLLEELYEKDPQDSYLVQIEEVIRLINEYKYMR